MKKISRLLMTVVIIVSAHFISNPLSAQTDRINLVEGAFDVPTTLQLAAGFGANGWGAYPALNQTTNLWQIGNLPGPLSNPSCAYIMTWPALNNYSYNTNIPSTSHLSKTVTVPSGEPNIQLTFSYKQNGELGNDRLLVYATPVLTFPTPGIPASPSTVVPGATLIFTGVPTGGVWTTPPPITIPASFAGSSFRVIFTWQNDGSGGVQAPAAIDDVRLTSSPCVPLTFTTVVTGVSCSGGANGSISVTASQTTGTLYSINGGAFTSASVFSALAAGSYTIRISNGGCLSAIQTVTVGVAPDVTPPTMNCPNSITVCPGVSGTGAVVNYFTPTAIDNCAMGTVALTAGLTSGSNFPLGVNTVTWTATDASSNSTSCSFSVTVNSPSVQTPRINAAQGAFDFPTTLNGAGGFGANGWGVHFVNQANVWAIGSAPGPLSAPKCAYISTTIFGTNYSYNTSSPSTSHIAKSVTVPAGESNIQLTFSYKQNGEDGRDRLLVYAAPLTTPFPVGGIPAWPSTVLPGSTLVFTGTSTGGVWTTPTIALPASFAGSSFRVIFTWQNDGSGGVQGPAAVDNVMVTSSCACNPPSFTGVVNNVSCAGGTNGSITISATPSAGTTYSINGGPFNANPVFSGLSAGTYTVQISNAGCLSGTQSFTVSTAADVTPPTISCPNNITVCQEVSGNIITYAMPTATDNCGATTLALIDGLASGSNFPAGANNVTWTATDASSNTASCSFTVTVNPNPEVSITPSVFICGHNVSCNGICDGIATADATNGSAPYTYLWSNGATTPTIQGLCAGSNSITVTDASGCTVSSSYTLTEPDALTDAAVLGSYNCGFNISCNGGANGSIDYTLNGGCQPYSLAWSNGSTAFNLTNLTAGVYTVTATDVSRCELVTTYTLTAPDPITVTGVSAVYGCGYNVSCYGATNGNVNITVNGGCAPYTYLWSTAVTTEDITNVSGNRTYTVTVIDANGCGTIASFFLTEPAPMTVSAGPNASVFPGYSPSACTTLNATGITGGCGPYSILWSNGVTTASNTVCPLTSTLYTVTVTDANGCTATDDVYVCAQNVAWGNNQVTICHNGNTIHVGTPSANNHLNHGDYLGACGGSGVTPCTPPAKTDGGSPESSSEVDLNDGLLEAFPNPFETSTTIRFRFNSDVHAVLKVYDLTGKAVAILFDSDAVSGTTYEVGFKPESMANGLFIARIETSEGAMLTHKLVLVK